MNPFDAATPHLIACYEANYRNGHVKPNYPVPAIRYKARIDTGRGQGAVYMFNMSAAWHGVLVKVW